MPLFYLKKILYRLYLETKFLSLRISDFLGFNKIYFELVTKKIIQKSVLHNRIISSKHKSPNQIFNKINQSDINKLINHEFDLLGSSYVKVNYVTKKNDIHNLKYKNYHDESKIIRIKSEINSFLGNEFDLDEYEPIDWQLDFISGYRWNENTWYRDIKVYDLDGVDIKRPWELSRLQHLPRLAFNYYIDNDKEHLAKECVYQITDWILNNRVRRGVNWRTTMEVSIRACNILLTVELIQNSKFVSKKFLSLVKKSMIDHGNHIMNNLEKSFDFSGHNHFMANVVGLVFLGICYESKLSNRWLTYGLKEFINSIDNQFHEDGGNFEGSSYYHRLVFEMILYNTILINNNLIYIDASLKKDNIFNNKIINKIMNSFNFYKNIISPNMRLFQYGDNDSGKFFDIASNNEKDFQRNLIDLANDFFSIQSNSESISTLFINDAVDRSSFKYNKINEEYYTLSKRSIFFPESKIYKYFNDNYTALCVLRSVFLGHTHNDLFSFELFLKNEPIIVDGGSYCYTSNLSLRDKFRNTINHNTLWINEKEQNKLIGVFEILKESTSSIQKISKNQIIASHNGYKKKHLREFIFEEKRMIIEDYFDDDSFLSINFAPNIKIEPIDNSAIKINSINSQLLLNLDNLEFLRLEDGNYSEGYGKMVQNKRLILKRVSPQTKLIINLKKN
tara:strand:+ start:1672 stop:3699 length:2028 start_codon:yes stop_codon:yes gene_type:complete